MHEKPEGVIVLEAKPRSLREKLERYGIKIMGTSYEAPTRRSRQLLDPVEERGHRTPSLVESADRAGVT